MLLLGPLALLAAAGPAAEAGAGISAKALLGTFLSSAAGSFGSSLGKNALGQVQGGEIYSSFEVPEKRPPREVRLSAPPPYMPPPDSSPLAASPIIRAYFERS